MRPPGQARMPTSATGSKTLNVNARCVTRGRRRHRVRSGFTLVELIVVLAVMGLALAVVPVSMIKLHEAMQYRSAVGEVLAGLKAARNEAVKTGRSVPFSIDVTTGNSSSLSFFC